MRTLTPKQERFVEEYLVDLNATQAAIRAGYSEKTAAEQGYENLRKPQVAEAIQEAMKARSERTEIDQDWVLNNLRSVAERCMQAKPVTDRNGEPVLAENADGDRVPAYTFNAMGANRSLELLGRHLAIFTDKHELTGKDGGPIATKEVSDKQKAMIIAAALAKVARAVE